MAQTPAAASRSEGTPGAEPSSPLWSRSRALPGGSSSSLIDGTDHLQILPMDASAAFRALKFMPLKVVERVTKINRVGRRQDRLLVISQTHLFIAVPADGDVQRVVEVTRIVRCRVYRPRLELLLEVPGEYNLMVQFDDQLALNRVVEALSLTAATVDEPMPINSREALIQKPGGFALQPMPTIDIMLPQWSRKTALAGSPEDPSLSASRSSFRVSRKLRLDAGTDPIAGFPSDVPSSDSFHLLGQEAPAVGPWIELEPVEVLADKVAPLPLSADINLADLGRIGESQGAAGAMSREQHHDTPDRRRGANEKDILSRFAAADDDVMNRPNLLPGVASDGGALDPQIIDATLRRSDRPQPYIPAADGGDTVQYLQSQLRAALETNADLAELLQAKRSAEHAMWREMDSLRQQIDRMSKDMLFLRRPWALDL